MIDKSSTIFFYLSISCIGKKNFTAISFACFENNYNLISEETMEENNNTVAPVRAKIKFGEKVAFTVGEVYGGGAVMLLDAFCFIFFTQIIGIEAGVAGTIMMLARFWDAITDPLMGTISDNTRTKIGRRRPYIIASSGLIIIALVLLFLPIQNWGQGKTAYAIIVYFLYGTVSTIFNVPYLSLSSEISENVKERSNMNMARLIIAAVASAVCYIVPDILIGMHREGTISDAGICFTISIGFGIFFAIPVLCSGLFTKERSPLPEQKAKFSLKNFSNTFKLKSFRRLLGMYVFSFVCNAIIMNLLMIFVYNISGGSDIRILGFKLSTLVFIVMFAAAGVMMPLVLIMLNKKVPKPVIFMIGIPVFLIGGVALAFFPSGVNPKLMLLCSAIGGIGYGFVQSIPWLTFPDIVDVAELKSNDRNPGAYNGTMTFFKKFASGLAVFLIGIVLQNTGYNSDLGTKALQPASAVTGMRLVLGISIFVFLILAFISAYKIKITTKKSERIRYFIDRQRAGTIDSLTEDEKSELNVISEELF